jgi:hypothetical protein
MRTRRSLTTVTCLVLALAMPMGVLPPARTRAAQPPQTALRPLEALLNPGGTLDLSTGFSGALDPSGWCMEYAPSGAPLFRPAGEPARRLGPANTWRPLGSGLNSSVGTIAVVGESVYVGGGFTDAGGNASAD